MGNRNKINFTEDDTNYGRYCVFNLETITNTATAFAKKHGVPVENVTFEFYSYESDYESESYLTVSGWRWENDAEYNSRIETEKKRIAAAKKASKAAVEKKKAAEYAKYLKLKEKYENADTSSST